MKITALEIRQKEFQKGFRGCDKDEVQAFLLSLSQEWERMVEQSKELSIRLENAEKEVQKLREVEDSLFKTLKTAETTGANVVEQANKSAELIVQEARMKAEQTIDDAQRKADRVFTSMLTEFSELEREFRTMENTRDNLHAEIRNLCNDSLDKVDRIDLSRKDFTDIKNLASKLAVEKNEILKSDVSKPTPNIESVTLNESNAAPVTSKENKEEEIKVTKEEAKPSINFEMPKKSSSDEITEEKPKDSDSNKSFFDEIED